MPGHHRFVILLVPVVGFAALSPIVTAQQNPTPSKKTDEFKQQWLGADTSTWNLGDIYRGQDVPLTLPLHNGCKLDQTVTVTYPTTIPIKGDNEFFVPANVNLDAPIVVKTSSLPAPPPDSTADQSCPLLNGKIEATKPSTKQVRETATSIFTYICDGMVKTYNVVLRLHYHPPPDGGGGSPGGGARRDYSCTNLWNTSRFLATYEKPARDSCRDQLLEMALAYYDGVIAPLKSQNPGAWSSASPSQLSQMSVDQILEWKARAERQRTGAQ